jgi:hypothetical protein
MTQQPGDGIKSGTLFVQALPWAELYIDSIKYDTTPLQDSIRLEPGAHAIRLYHPAYPAHEQQVRIGAGETALVRIDLDTLFSYLIPRVYPWGRIYIDSIYWGQTPLAGPIVLPPGEHQIRVTNPDYGAVQRSIRTARRETLVVDFNMEDLERSSGDIP